MKTKICKLCGKQFTPNSPRQLYCNEDVIKECKICGRDFTSRCNPSASNTCSLKCSNEYAFVKMRSALPEVQCALCNKLFKPTTNTQKVCPSIHYRNCVVCGKEFIVNTKTSLSSEWAVTCSRSCRGKRASGPEHIQARQQGYNKIRTRKYADRPELLENYNLFTSDPTLFLSKFDHKLTIMELSELIGVHPSTSGQLINKFNVRDMIDYNSSSMERDVTNFINSIVNTQVVCNTRQVITPYELDIYLPEFKFAIECNPTSTHNSSKPMVEGDPTPRMYHINKSNMCEQQGIQLFHLFGYDWSTKRNIIESMLRNKLNANECKVYARKCTVVKLDSETTNEFLDANHRQGSINSSVRLGLMHGDELVSVMTFSRLRHSIGKQVENADSYELLRFCSKLNNTVVGGAGKLFTYFIKNYHPTLVRSFSDRARTSGGLYSSLGFSKESVSSTPGYVWVNEKTDIAYHRINAQKQNIRKFLKDDTIDLSKTEKQIMEEHGFVQVFDSGTINWEWHK